MKHYTVAVPITGWQVFDVECEDDQDPVELVNNGEVDTDEFDDIKWDTDINHWEIEEIEEIEEID